MRLWLFDTEVDIGFFFAAMIAMLLIVDKTGLMSMSLASAALHESGHLAAMAALGKKPRKISLRVGSMSIVTRGFTDRVRDELIVSLSGPVANILGAAAAFAIYRFTGAFDMLVLCTVMAATAIFSLLPVSGLDGGDVLRCALSLFLSEETSRKITLIITAIFLLILAAVGIYLLFWDRCNPTLLIVAVYLAIIAIIGNRHQKSRHSY